jgi:hypothetical protein
MSWKMTAAALAQRTAELGYPISRVAIGKLENNHREGKFDLGELIVLAEALSIPEIALIYGGHPDEPVELLPAYAKPSFEALARFIGDDDLADGAVAEPDSPAATLLRLTRKRAEREKLRRWINRLAAAAAEKEDEKAFTPAIEKALTLMDEIDDINAEIAKVAASKEIKK